MASITLAEAAKLSTNPLIRGVIQETVTVNQMFELLPFAPIDGNAIKYIRENAIGDSQVAGVGDTITAKAAASFTEVTSALTTIIGDAEVNGMVASTMSYQNDQVSTQIASKAKSIGRKYQDMLINGTGSSNQFSGLLLLTPSSQKLTPSTNGDALSFAILDALIDMVKDKDGQVDYFMMNSRTIRSLKTLLRGLGGAGVNETLMLPSGKTVLTYSGIPVFRNDWIPINQTQGSSSTCTTIFAGTFDDGSQKYGISGLNAAANSGIHVVDVGEKEAADEHIYRVKWYTGLALYSQLGIAACPGITN